MYFAITIGIQSWNIASAKKQRRHVDSTLIYRYDPGYLHLCRSWSKLPHITILLALFTDPAITTASIVPNVSLCCVSFFWRTRWRNRCKCAGLLLLPLKQIAPPWAPPLYRRQILCRRLNCVNEFGIDLDALKFGIGLYILRLREQPDHYYCNTCLMFEYAGKKVSALVLSQIRQFHRGSLIRFCNVCYLESSTVVNVIKLL